MPNRSTVVSIHPQLCGPTGGCPEEKNEPSLCPQGCYEVRFQIEIQVEHVCRIPGLFDYQGENSFPDQVAGRFGNLSESRRPAGGRSGANSTRS